MGLQIALAESKYKSIYMVTINVQNKLQSTLFPTILPNYGSADEHVRTYMLTWTVRTDMSPLCVAGRWHVCQIHTRNNNAPPHVNFLIACQNNELHMASAFPIFLLLCTYCKKNYKKKKKRKKKENSNWWHFFHDKPLIDVLTVLKKENIFKYFVCLSL